MISINLHNYAVPDAPEVQIIPVYFNGTQTLAKLVAYINQVVSIVIDII